jgi:hypothetical protein
MNSSHANRTFSLFSKLASGMICHSFGRKSMRLSTFAVAIAFLLPSPLHAQEKVTIGGIVVKIPQGWTQLEKDNTLVLTPPELPAAVVCTLTLLGGEPYEGTVAEQLAVEWKGFAALGTIASDSGDSILGTGGPVEVGGRSARIDINAQKSIYVLLYVAKSNRRVDKMVFVSSDFDAFGKYSAAVSEILAGAEYIAPKPFEPLSGVCFGFSQVKSETRAECWIFLPNGVVYQGFPIGGPAALDVAYQRARRNGDVGEYHTMGNEVVVTIEKEKESTHFSRGKNGWTAPVTREFQDRRRGRDGSTIATWTDHATTTLNITHVDPCDGLKLSGTYRLEKPWGTIPTITFTPDGNFSEDGLILGVIPMTLKEGGGQVDSGLPPKGGDGKYTIEKNTLNLTYADGRKIGMTFLIANTPIARSNPREVFLQRSKLLLAP